jgi:hypothetical protein
MLNAIDISSLFIKDGGWEEYHLANFLEWRQLFHAAAEQGELLLLGVC